LDHLISLKYIYTILKLNRYNIYKDLLLIHNIKVEKNNSNISKTSIDTLNNSHTISFSIQVTDIWPQISDEKVKYNFKNKRNVHILQCHAWTSIFYERLYNETKLPCALTFKCVKISAAGIFSVTGKCTKCKCSFVGQIINTPQKKNNVTMECTIHSYDSSVKHKKRRHLIGLDCKQVAYKLVEDRGGHFLVCGEESKLIF